MPMNVDQSEIKNTESGNKLSVFISYSRDDLDFADQLDAALDLHDFDVTLDRHNISGGEDWQAQLGALIRDADTVAFVLSPSSAPSEICRWEVAEATRFGKRIIPILCRPLDDAEPPSELANRNYIYFYNEPKSPGSGFGAGLVKLVKALNTDLDWLREHTRLLRRATEWNTAGRDESRLLFGDSIAEAKTWNAQRPKDAPEPITLHLEFIRASEEAETRRQSEDRRQLEKMAAAQAASAQALAEKVAAQKREEKATRRVVRTTRIGAMVASLLAIVAGGLALYAFAQNANSDAATAKSDAATMEAKTQEALAIQAKRRVEKLIDLLLDNLKAHWPEDLKSPDYRHLAVEGYGKKYNGTEFNLTAELLEALLVGNNFNPTAMDGKIVFALRGAALKESSPILDAASVTLKDTRPDHKSFQSIFIVFDQPNRTLSAFIGSTVPNRRGILSYFRQVLGRQGGNSNLQPTGMYGYIVGGHSGNKIPCILRMNGLITTLRSLNNLAYETTDLWHHTFPANNLIPSFFLNKFSSYGALTIRGTANREVCSHSHDFRAFQKVLGITEQTYRKRVDIVLLTGLDAAVMAAHLADPNVSSLEQRMKSLRRLRQGSSNENVKILQKALGLPENGFFGPKVVENLVKFQHEKLVSNSSDEIPPTDGIYSPEMDVRLGLCVLRDARHCPPAQGD